MAAWRRVRAALLLFMLAWLVFASPTAAASLEYDRAAIATGQVWRILTCHWTHWNLDHLIWDALTFVVLGAMCERASRAAFAWCVVASAVVISGAVWVLLPDMEQYRGLSGIDCALFALLTAQMWRRAVDAGQWRTLALLVLLFVALAAKVGFEFVTGTNLFVASGADFVPVPLAHAVGGGVGLIVGLQSAHNRAAPAAVAR